MIDTEALRKKVIDLAIQGKLTQQLPEDGNADELYVRIQEEKEKLIKKGKIRKEKALPNISDEEIPFEIPVNWKWVRVADIAYLSSGKPYEETEEGKLYIKVSDMNLPENETQIITSTHFVAEENDGIIPVNSIIFPKRGGAIATNKKRMILQNPVFVDLNTMGMTVLCADIFMYVKYWFDTMKLDEIQNGTAIPQVNNKDIYPLILPLPPVEEQKRIVEIIDRVLPQIDVIDELQQQYESDCEILKEKIIDAGIRGKLTEQLPEDGNAEDLYVQIQEEKAKLIKAGKIKKEKPLPEISDDEIPFEIPDNWKWVHLQDIGSWSAGATPSRKNSEYYRNGTIPWVKTGELNDGHISDVEEYITEKAFNECSVRLNPAGSVLIAMYGATIGKVGILEIDATTNQACCACIPIMIDNRFLFYFLKRNKEYFINASHGGAQPNISKEIITQSVMPLPPREEQKRIAERIAKLIGLIA